MKMKKINHNKVDIDTSPEKKNNNQLTGLLLGTGIGASLCTIGILAPFDVGILSIVAFATTIGGGLALISGAMGVDTIKLSPQSEMMDSTAPPQESYKIMSKSLGAGLKRVNGKVDQQQTPQKSHPQMTEKENSLDANLSTHLPATGLKKEKTVQSEKQSNSSLFF
ncbi:Uncharacterised protein [Legionella cincinnatiensis]|uniref:Transmembrane protein n=2 Tax=Legionella cincinnatiensis TaxID=28085 RepID=A0A378II84_9GAMM|nr:hypothetical protein Lcin_0370 [Legionella cincinnatiensis]STX34967.1 Uncharacterised protein [Legionella cincinnatiensis]